MKDNLSVNYDNADGKALSQFRKRKISYWGML